MFEIIEQEITLIGTLWRKNLLRKQLLQANRIKFYQVSLLRLHIVLRSTSVQEKTVSPSQLGEERLFSNTRKLPSYRSEIRRDYARVLHSSSFRRLEHKTQLFPGHESDFFRNRLTHSLEVAQIAKTIACKLIEENPSVDISPDVCEVAGLLHDLGHPPFGHNGEKALDDCMINFGGFEGNAQTLRIITKLEKKELGSTGECLGLNLTHRTIASILKYDKEISVSRKAGAALQKGYYYSEKEIVQQTKIALGLDPDKKIKTAECAIMDLADDIAYSTYDIEDAFKADFLTPLEMMGADIDLLESIAQRLQNDHPGICAENILHYLILLFIEAGMWKEYETDIKSIDAGDPDALEKSIFATLGAYSYSKMIASDGFLRTEFTSSLVNRFIEGVQINIDPNNTMLSVVRFDNETSIIVGILKHFTYEYLTSSSRLKVVENRGYKIVKEIFKKLDENHGYEFLPDDFKKMYLCASEDIQKKRVICDFIAGMTDRYASEYHGRLFSESPQTIFKPF